MYTGTCGATIVEASSLLELATKFKVAGSIEECSSLMIKNLTIDNAIPIFQQAMMSAHPELIITSLDFICA
jgi:hypothetical protein